MHLLCYLMPHRLYQAGRLFYTERLAIPEVQHLIFSEPDWYGIPEISLLDELQFS